MFYLFILFLVAALFIYHPRIKSYVIEGRLRLYIKELNFNENYIVFHDIKLPTLDGHTTQIDHIILSSYGIFIIEAKSHKFLFIGEKTNQHWNRATQRLDKQVQVLERFLGDMPFIPIIILSPAASLNSHQQTCPVHVTYDFRLMRLIRQYRKKIIPSEELVKLEYIIFKNMIVEGKVTTDSPILKVDIQDTTVNCLSCEHGFESCLNYLQCPFAESRKYI